MHKRIFVTAGDFCLINLYKRESRKYYRVIKLFSVDDEMNYLFSGFVRL